MSEQHMSAISVLRNSFVRPFSVISGEDNYEHVEDDRPTKPETIHYLSPATTARSELEGDLQQYFRFREVSVAYPTTPSPTREPSEETIICDEDELQRTLVIVKPEALVYKDAILRAIIHAGLLIINERTVHLAPEQVAELFFQHYGYPYFPTMVVKISQSPILVVSVYGINAVARVKRMVGPGKGLREEWFYPRSMKIKFGPQKNIPESIHTSEKLKDSMKENRYFFPDPIIEPILIEREKFLDYFELMIKPTLLNACAELVRAKPIEPIIYLAEWLLLNNVLKPTMPYPTAMAPT